MIANSAGSDSVLLEDMFEQRKEFFAKDVVISGDAAAYIAKHSAYRNMNSRHVGRLLTCYPFNGQPHQFRVGKAMYRCIILRNFAHWRYAPGADIMAHLNGADTDMNISVDGDSLLD